jgi:CheY-like chemotaxis protein
MVGNAWHRAMVIADVKPLHLLVTDDDVDKRMLLGRAISREFPYASVFECHSGKEALEYFLVNHVDAIITDHNMYPVSGLELVAELRRRGSSVPIIMVSGHEEIKTEAEAAGVDLFLPSTDLVKIGQPIAAFLKSRGLFDRAESGSDASPTVDRPSHD